MQLLKGENDFYTSVEKAFDEIDEKWRYYPGLVVVGSHVPSDVEEKITAIREVRENNIPFLGICFGMQLMVIEFARNVLGIKDATSEEFGEKGTCIIVKLPSLRVGMFEVVDENHVRSLESHWHNYEIMFRFYTILRDRFSIRYSPPSPEMYIELLRLKDHPFFMGVQFHPEYQSSKDKPHPILKEFIEACKNS